jgi:hypothetical protein
MWREVRSECKGRFRKMRTFQSVMNVQERRKDTGRKLNQIKEERNEKELRKERRNTLREKSRNMNRRCKKEET